MNLKGLNKAVLNRRIWHVKVHEVTKKSDSAKHHHLARLSSLRQE